MQSFFSENYEKNQLLGIQFYKYVKPWKRWNCRRTYKTPRGRNDTNHVV